MNRPEPTGPYRSLTAYFSESIKDRDVEFWHNYFSIGYENGDDLKSVFWKIKDTKCFLL